MFEKLKALTTKDLFKYFGISILALIFLSILFAVLSFVFSGISSNFSMQERESSMMNSLSKSSSYGRYTNADSIGGLGEANMAEPGAPAMDQAIFEVKNYSARFRTNDPETDCNAFLSGIDRSYVQVRSVNSSKNACSFTFLVPREKETDFLSYLRSRGLYDLASNIENVKKPYSTVADRVKELEKRLTETDALLTSTKTQYDQLWESLKSKNVSAESIDALNRIITNKAELISKFSKERLSIMDEIDRLNKAKADYEEKMANVEFSAYFEKYAIFDWQNTKDRWFADARELGRTFDDTVRNLTVNLGSFLLKTLNVTVYVVLGAFFLLAGGKMLYRMGRRILFGKE
jgi:hypothetical protein